MIVDVALLLAAVVGAGAVALVFVPELARPTVRAPRPTSRLSAGIR